MQEQAPVKKRVLMIDDDPNFVADMKRRFEKENYEYESAMTPEEALPKAIAFKPDITFIDVDMPDADQVCTDLKVKSGIVKMPIFLLLYDIPEGINTVCRHMGLMGYVRRILPMEIVENTNAFFVDVKGA